MSPPTKLTDLFRRDRRPAGVLGLVDEVTAYCRARGVRLTWGPDAAVAEPVGGGPPERVAVDVRPSAFRAVLARLAALCNRDHPGSVSPYGGVGEFRDAGPPPASFRVSFTNTPDEQRLELTPLAAEVPAVQGNETGTGGPHVPDTTPSLT